MASKHCVLCFTCSAGGGNIFFAQLRFILSVEDTLRRKREVALVRWLDSAPSSAAVSELRMQRRRWATVRRRKGGSDAWYDAVTLSSITRPVFLQPDPLMEGQFFVNDYVH